MDTVVLVTGANGFVGRNLLKALRDEKEFRVVATDLHETLIPMVGVDAGGIEYRQGDLADRAFVENLRDTVDFKCVVHLAAVLSQTPDTNTYFAIMNSNIKATFLLLDATRQRDARFLFPSTALVYGNRKGPFTEEMVPEPGDFYALSKLTSEQLIRFYAGKYGVRSLIFRIGILYGPSQAGAMFIPALVSSLLDGREFPMTGGEQTRDFVYIEDFITLLASALRHPEFSGTYNIGTGSPVMLRDLAVMAERLTGVEGKVKVGAIPYRPNESWEYCLDSTKARRTIGWFAGTNLEQGIMKTIDYENNRRRTHA